MPAQTCAAARAGGWRDELAGDVANRFNPEDRELLEQLGYTA